MNINELNSKLDWEVEEKAIQICGGKKIAGRKAIVRSDNGNILHVAKNSYTPTPNLVFRGIVQKMAEVTGYQLDGFHEIQGGQKLFAYLKNPNDIEVVGNKSGEWISIGNAHNGTSKLFFSTTQLMYRCANQFSKVHKGRNMSFSHTSGHIGKVEKFKSTFETILGKRAEMLEQMNRMSEVAVSNKDIESLCKYLLKIEEVKGDKREELHGRTKNQLIGLEESIDQETADLGSNLFGLLQGVTRFTTHKKKIKHSNFGNVVGTCADFNNLAFNFLLRTSKERQRTLLPVN